MLNIVCFINYIFLLDFLGCRIFEGYLGGCFWVGENSKVYLGEFSWCHLSLGEFFGLENI